jgi:DNA-binding CsgD family transcriptional regulator/PAS domain-containing protein
LDRAQALPLVQQIYEATLDPSCWQAFVQSLSDTFLGAPVGFALQLPGFPLSRVVYVSSGFRDEFLELFVQHATNGLPWEEARRRDFVGRFGLTTEVISIEHLHESDFYRNWMVPQGLGPHPPIGHTIALDQGRPVAGLAIFPTPESGPFDATHLAFGDLLVPHLELGYRLLAQTRRHEALADAIDRFPTGVALLDARGVALMTNRAAQAIFEQDDGLSLVNGTPRAAASSDDTALRRAIDEAVAASTDGRDLESAVLAIPRRSEKRPYPILVGPLHPHSGGPTLADAVALLYVSDLDRGGVRRRNALRELYGLTEAEAHLAELLCQGSSLEEAAHVRGVTMNTARSQLKQVFAKTHTSRQSELVRLVLTGVASMGGP